MEATADHWLIQLGMMGPREKHTARALLVAQLHTSTKRGHLIDLRSRYVRDAVRASSREGTIANCYASCARCGCIAPLISWVVYAAITPDDADRLLTRHEFSGKRDGEFLSPCQANVWIADACQLFDIDLEKELA